MVAVYSLTLLTTGCASYNAREIKPTGIKIAQVEIPARGGNRNPDDGGPQKGKGCKRCGHTNENQLFHLRV